MEDLCLIWGTATFLDRRSPANIRKSLVSLQRASNKYGKAKSRVSNQKYFETLGGEKERTTATKGFAGRGTGGDPARLHAMSTRPTGSAVPEPLQAGRQGAAGGQPPPPPFRTLETSVRGKPDRHRAHSPAAPRPSTTGPRFPLWGEPRSPRDATGGSRDGRQPHGARSLGGRLPLGRPEAGPPPPRVVSPRPCPPRGPRPLPSSVPGFLAAMPRATGGSPARLRPPRSRPAAAGSGGDTGRAAPGRAVPCPGEAVSPGSRGGKPDCPPCFKRRRQMPPRCPR